jgi:hypothetical protein
MIGCMTMIGCASLIAQLFVSPIHITGSGKVALIVPLCLSISVVYKTTKLNDLRSLPLSALGLCATIVCGMYAVGAGLWTVHWLLAG